MAQLFAVGDQHYTANGTAWILMNATAELFNSRFEKVGIHFYEAQVDSKGGQPSWMTPCPRSLVTGKRVFTAQVQNNSITWALLEATNSHGSSGLFGRCDLRSKAVHRTGYLLNLRPQKSMLPSARPTHLSTCTTSSCRYKEADVEKRQLEKEGPSHKSR
ncbi:hypothetical protein MPTK1_8g02760 [Marchantia polymorpha subsp. ruderalis]|uniref:Uncharacterized protein n=1 Tax=Marchantia polymorpha TaxID=3197 RepID=A0A2R6XJ54_MARPO|nr:hypothetical protein MARPO_0012s0069 [Marchantia polymorpha]BBN18467.1 hypothetical protein Mp_8g02760 [Marchantia polymorpha subsp. ruderalis]|eukprot:PTQ46112.1 hypothetical protein MARPO_0012s0069 [Marchantia polymorpha]